MSCQFWLSFEELATNSNNKLIPGIKGVNFFIKLFLLEWEYLYGAIIMPQIKAYKNICKNNITSYSVPV